MILSLTLLLSGCSKRTTYSEVETFYNINSANLIDFITFFSSQNKIFSIVRNEAESIGPINISELRYSINTEDNQNIEIPIPSYYNGNENSFWAKPYNEINSYDNQKLSDFLNFNKLDRALFEKCKDFIFLHKLYAVSKVVNEQYIVLNFRMYDGLLYSPDDSKPRYAIAKDIKKIASNFYYFRLY